MCINLMLHYINIIFKIIQIIIIDLKKKSKDEFSNN